MFYWTKNQNGTDYKLKMSKNELLAVTYGGTEVYQMTRIRVYGRGVKWNPEIEGGKYYFSFSYCQNDLEEQLIFVFQYNQIGKFIEEFENEIKRILSKRSNLMNQVLVNSNQVILSSEDLDLSSADEILQIVPP